MQDASDLGMRLPRIVIIAVTDDCHIRRIVERDCYDTDDPVAFRAGFEPVSLTVG